MRLLPFALILFTTACGGIDHQVGIGSPDKAPAAKRSAKPPPSSFAEKRADSTDTPAPISGRYVATNEHQKKFNCGDIDCRVKERGRSEVTLELKRDGAATLRDDGQRTTRLMSPAARTKAVNSWKRSWNGTWTQRDDETVLVSLTPASTACEGTKCKAVPLTLKCHPWRVRVVKPTDGDAWAWVCNNVTPTNDSDMTRFPYVFGIDTALTAIDRGRGSRSRRWYGKTAAAK